MKINVIYKKKDNTRLISHINPENPNWKEDLQKKGREIGADFAWVGSNQIIGIRYDDKMAQGLTGSDEEC